MSTVPWCGWEPASEKHCLEGMSVGLDAANTWLKKALAMHEQKRITTITYLDSAGKACAFFSTKMNVSRTTKDVDNGSEGEVASHLLWCGIREDLQGQGAGKHLINQYLKYAVDLSTANPFRMIILDVADTAPVYVRSMYTKMGFTAETKESPRMRMKISSARKRINAIETAGYQFAGRLSVDEMAPI